MHINDTAEPDRAFSLRTRLILAIVVLVTLISSVFVIAIWEIKVRLEAVAFGRMAVYRRGPDVNACRLCAAATRLSS